jgi:hypothetical protein
MHSTEVEIGVIIAIMLAITAPITNSRDEFLELHFIEKPYAARKNDMDRRPVWQEIIEYPVSGSIIIKNWGRSPISPSSSGHSIGWIRK